MNTLSIVIKNLKNFIIKHTVVFCTYYIYNYNIVCSG